MTWANLKRWWRDPSLKWYDQHPVAHAAGGLVFIVLAALDLALLRRPDYVLLLAVLALEAAAAWPMIERENQNRPMLLRVIAVPLALTLVFGTLLAVLLPWAWKPWALAAAAQTTWELLQRAAWRDASGRSTYPSYSVILDAGTASLVAAAITFLYGSFA